MTAPTRPAPAPAGPLGPLSAATADLLGIGLTGPAQSHTGRFAEMAGLALRDNPRRAHLVVSRVLGKHVPVAPGVLIANGMLLGARAARELAGLNPPVVIGYCETATGLGHDTARGIAGADYLHTTRRPDPSVPVLARFDEEHSHAVAHLLQPADPSLLLDPDRPLVLVDDELTTGRTALNTVAALHALAPRRRYVIAALMDLRPTSERAAFAARSAELGVDVRVVSLLSADLTVPADALTRAAHARDVLAAAPPGLNPGSRTGQIRRFDAQWPDDLPTGARTGMTPHDTARFDHAVTGLGRRLAGTLGGGPVLVVGTEELMHLPARIAAALEHGHDGPVTVQSTTRSPVLAADLPDYAIRRTVEFPSPDDPSRTSRLHNLADPVVGVPGERPSPYSGIVIVTDSPAGTAGPLARALLPWATLGVHIVDVPAAATRKPAL